MALTTIDVLERVRNRVAPDADERSIQKIDFIIETNIPGALNRLGRTVAQSAEFRLLQKEFAVPPVAGIADVGAQDTGNQILWDTVERTGTVRETTDTTNKRPFIRVPRRSSLYSANPTTDAIHYFVEANKKLALKGADGVLGTYITPVTLTASIIPTLALLPAQFEDLFIDILTEMVGVRGGAILGTDEATLPVKSS
jgi:hypothetical protein